MGVSPETGQSEIPDDFRGLVYAPSSEQEVVALFSLMLPHLERRFAIEEVCKGVPRLLAMGV